eukprot:7366296-Alexandrium_andersonii.AAC.1
MRPMWAVRAASDSEAAYRRGCQGRGGRGDPTRLHRAHYVGRQAGCPVAESAGRRGALGPLRGPRAAPLRPQTAELPLG